MKFLIEQQENIRCAQRILIGRRIFISYSNGELTLL